ncbi:hypothetical protein CRM92_04075 [Rothia dentocariosa]|uniref:Uncharacterized protein n=2 Tax=Rothia TaxID=32207 RepID=A0A2A8D8I6_9MICC|nr:MULTISPECIES: hypothetical protein [Rothia]OFR95378.1 hypothetical protein HMPREF2756_03845 [Rothia sp. HMSC067H10]PEN17200.1 hypothetical protein CRM92_04075 [Rothia dentocariosa]
MTTNKDLLKPEHGTIQAQDAHEIKKESEADSAGNRNLFLSIFITVQIIRLMLETTLLQGVMISALPNGSGYVDFRVLLLTLILFSPFIVYILLQTVACIKMIRGTKTAWVLGTNIYSLLIIAPLAAFYTSFVIEVTASNVDIRPLQWMLGACVLEAIMSIFTIIVVSIYNWKKKKLSSHNKNMDTDKHPMPDNTLSGFKNAIYETDDLKTLKKHHEDPIVEIPWQHVNVRSQKKDQGEQQ